MKMTLANSFFGRRSMKNKRYFGQNARPSTRRITPLNPRNELNRNLMKYDTRALPRRTRILNKLKEGKYFLNENNLKKIDSL